MDNDQQLIRQFISNHQSALVSYVEDLSNEELVDLIESLEPDLSATVVSLIVPYKSGRVLEKIPAALAAELINRLSMDISQSILRIIDSSVREQILQQVSQDKGASLRRALKYKPDQVGAHIEPFVLTLTYNNTVGNALAMINNSEAMIIPHIFILNEQNRLLGYVELKELIRTDPKLQVQSLLKTISQPALADMSVGGLQENWDNSFTHLPVVKSNGLFLGTVSRATLGKVNVRESTIDKSLVKAGNALGDLYMIGLTSLLGNSSESNK